jgi:hypothetical protein
MSEAAVRRRHVYFLSGFDPKGASYYHGLYRSEAAKQGALTDTQYEVGPRVRLANGNTVWQVRTQAGGETTETSFEYLQWDDIVRTHWARTSWQVLIGSLRGYQAALASITSLLKVWRASRRTLVALALPAFFWLFTLVLGAGLGFAVGHVLAKVLPPAVAGLLGLATASAVAWAAYAWEKRLATSWLLRIYQFAGDWRAGRTPELQERLQPMADEVLKRVNDPEVDEVLLVGFSVGSMLAVSVAARVQRGAKRDGIDLDRLSMMTLGHCIPLLGLMAGADDYRAELASLGQAPRVRWVDFSSVTDWGSFALVDPLSICLGEGGSERPYAPRMASPRFHLMFEPALYRELVKDKRRMHLQYLMSAQRAALYDYFAITAGRMSMPDRMNLLPPA